MDGIVTGLSRAPVRGALLWLALFLGSAASAQTTVACGDETIRKAALDKLWVPLRFYDAREDAANDDVDQDIVKRAEKLRPWAASIADACIRSAYGHWIDAAENNAKARMDQRSRRNSLPEPPQ